MPLILALDIGGTKLACGLVDDAGVVAGLQRRTTRARSDPDELFADVVRLLDDVRAASGPGGAGDDEVVGVGVGCGGPMTQASVSPLNIPAWRDFPLRDRLEEATGLPVVVDNDAKAMVLAECWRGAAVGCADVLGMVVSTGVGGGIVSRGVLLDGAGGNAGHVGHVCVEPDGALCGCGARGCLEAEASGTAVARRAVVRCAAGDMADGPLLQRWRASGSPGADACVDAAAAGPVSDIGGFSAVDVVAAAEAGDEDAAGILAAAGRAVGRAVASVAALVDLQLAVIGGGLAGAAGEDFWRALHAELHERARLDFTRSTRAVSAGCGADAGVVGAAALFRRHVGAGVVG